MKRQLGFKLKNVSDADRMKIAFGYGIFGDWFPDSESLNKRNISKYLYYARLAVEYHGMAVRDNTFDELVSIGRSIDKGDENE